MNEINNANPVAAKRGRPLNPNATRILRVNPETKQVYSKGRISEGKPVLELVVHRRYSSKNFIYGDSPVVSENLVNFHAKHKVKPVGNVQVIITEPAVEIPAVAESQPIANGEPVAA